MRGTFLSILMTYIHEHHMEAQHYPTDSINGTAAKNLSANKERILHIWEKLCRNEVPANQDKSSVVVRNELSTFLDHLIQALSPKCQKVNATEDNDSAINHGRQRAKFVDYSLPQIVREYGLLREIVYDVLNGLHPLTPQEIKILHRSIDEAVSQATSEYTESQTSELTSALTKAERSNKDLEHFAAIAAHDLKAPLSSIAGFSELLSQEYLTNASDEIRQSLAFINTATKRMSKLIDDLLSFALVHLDKSKFQSVDMNAVVNEAIDNLQRLIADARARVFHTGLPVLNGDRSLLLLIFQNLISNGIKFQKGDHAPEIQIQAEPVSDGWIFSVKDNGIGFETKNKEEIFTLYKRLHGDTKYPGSGIGLATCRRIAELHSGKIWAESTPGEGSTFHIFLPK
jgi:signal transduction histidine kinase